MKRRPCVLIQPNLLDPLEGGTPDFVEGSRGVHPPLGLLYVHAAVEAAGHDAVFIDAHLEGLSHRDAAAKALSHAPRVVGLQAMTFTLRDAAALADEIKALDPGVRVVLGGPHPTLYPRETAALPSVDIAVAGEGEKTFVRLLDALDAPDAWRDIPGLAYKTKDGVVETAPCAWIADVDSVPFPARHRSRYRDYVSVLSRNELSTVMITSRGCPFQCIFCNRMGRTYRPHSADYVLREMEEIRTLGIREVFIHDDTFSIRRDRVVAICRGLLDRQWGMTWSSRTRVDCVDEDLLDLMARAGCRRLSFGVESGSERILALMKKGIDLARVRRVFAHCRRIGITTLADFMFGNLGETREDIEKTLSFVRELSPDYVQFNVLSPYPGTPLYNMAMERGIVAGDVWRAFARNPTAPLRLPRWTEHFSEEELRRITVRAYRSFYFRPSMILRHLVSLRRPKRLASMLRGAVGLLFPRRAR